MPPLPTRRVVVTGIGLVTPLGVGVPESWRRLMAGECGIRQLTEEDLPEAHRPALASLACRIAGLVPRGQLEAAAVERGLAEEARRFSRFTLMALVAAAEALEDARWAPATEAQRAATGVALGAGMSCTAEVAEAGAAVAAGRGRRVSPYFVPRILPNMAAGAISIRHGLRGPNHAASTACATGGHGVGDAFRMIQRGDADVMLAGAAEACVDAISLTGFSRLKALSTGRNHDPHRASRPFDAGRDGFVMGEGAGVLVLEEAGHAAARGARVYAEVRGYGLSGDGHHVTAPHPEGAGALAAMRRALAGSGLGPGRLAYINAHATSTPAGDAIEQAAIRELLGAAQVGEGEGEVQAGGAGGQRGHERQRGGGTRPAAGPGLGPLAAVGSTKGATGHLLGAAGAVEAAFTVLALRHRRAPPTLNLERPEPRLLPGLVGPAPVELPPPAAGPIAALSNSFGFGGTNSCLLFASVD